MGLVFFNQTTAASKVATILSQFGVVPNITPVQIICVGGGAGSGNSVGGNAGSVNFFQGILTTLYHAVTVGNGGNGANNGQPSSFGTLVSAAGGTRNPSSSGGTGSGGSGGGVSNVIDANATTGTGTGGSAAHLAGGGGGGFPFFGAYSYATPGSVIGTTASNASGGFGLGAGGGGGVGSGSNNSRGASGGIIVCW